MILPTTALTLPHGCLLHLSRILDFDPATRNPDTATWLPGALLNIAHCALCSARGAPAQPRAHQGSAWAAGIGEGEWGNVSGWVEGLCLLRHDPRAECCPPLRLL